MKFLLIYIFQKSLKFILKALWNFYKIKVCLKQNNSNWQSFSRWRHIRTLSDIPKRTIQKLLSIANLSLERRTAKISFSSFFIFWNRKNKFQKVSQPLLTICSLQYHFLYRFRGKNIFRICLLNVLLFFHACTSITCRVYASQNSVTLSKRIRYSLNDWTVEITVMLIFT